MKIEVKRIGKAEAENMLSANSANRALSNANVAVIASEMSSGRFKETGDSIKISNEGVLLDGQHRLAAIVKSNTIHNMLVVSELPSDVFDVLDIGKKRNSKDVLSISGVKNSGQVSGIIKVILSYEQEALNAGGGYYNQFKTPSIVLNRYNSNPDYFDALGTSAAKYYFRSNLLTTQEYGLLLHILSKISRDNAEEFFDKLSTGVALSQNDPIYLLRERLLKYKTSKLKVSLSLKIGLVFKAWNAFRRGRTLTTLTFNSVSENISPI